MIAYFYSLIYYCVLINLFAYLNAFPSGAPADACDSLMPRHPGTHAIFDKSPFYVVASDSSYDMNDIFSHRPKSIKVNISGPPFKGFMVTAIDPHTGKRIGEFNTVKGTSKLPCSAITHTDNRLKKYASLLWVPPKDKRGYVTFIATVVHSFDHYYPGIVAEVHAPYASSKHNHHDVNMEHTIEDPLLK